MLQNDSENFVADLRIFALVRSNLRHKCSLHATGLSNKRYGRRLC